MSGVICQTMASASCLYIPGPSHEDSEKYIGPSLLLACLVEQRRGENEERKHPHLPGPAHRGRENTLNSPKTEDTGGKFSAERGSRVSTFS